MEKVEVRVIGSFTARPGMDARENSKTFQTFQGGISHDY